MRDKHLHIAKDSELLKTIYRKVEEELVINKSDFYVKILAKFLCYFGMLVLCYWSLFSIINPIIFIGCFVLFGILSLLIAFNFGHDLSHNSIFKNKKHNHFGYVFVFIIVGAHAEAWKQRHIHSHHFAPNVEDYDSDLKITKLIRVIPKSEYFWYHRFQYLYAPIAYMSYSLFWIFIKDFVLLFSKDEYTIQKNIKYHFSFWIQKICYLTFVLVMPLLFSHQSVSVVLLGFIVMHLIQSFFLLFTFFMTHHVEATNYPCTNKDGYIDTSWVMNQIKSSNDMHPFSRTANFILGGFNNHIAHHLFPHYHHIYYPKLNKILYKVLKTNNIQPNQTSYMGGMISHLKLLKRMGSISS